MDMIARRRLVVPVRPSGGMRNANRWQGWRRSSSCGRHFVSISVNWWGPLCTPRVPYWLRIMVAIWPVVSRQPSRLVGGRVLGSWTTPCGKEG